MNGWKYDFPPPFSLEEVMGQARVDTGLIRTVHALAFVSKWWREAPQENHQLIGSMADDTYGAFYGHR